jgi:hypothetical protein
MTTKQISPARRAALKRLHKANTGRKRSQKTKDAISRAKKEWWRRVNAVLQNQGETE